MGELIGQCMDTFKIEGEEMQQHLRTSLKDIWSEESVTSNLSALMKIYPQAEVAKGDSWTNQQAVRSTMSFMLHHNWTLDEISEQEVKISGRSSISVPEAMGMSQLEGISARYDLKGDQNTTIVAELATGWINSSQARQRIEGTIEVDKNQYFPNGVSWPIIFESVLTISRLHD